MKKLLTTFITSTVSQPIRQGTLNHLQEAHQETAIALAKTIIGNSYSSGIMYILHGCVATGTDPGVRTFTAGAIFYNNEIYLVDAVSFTSTGGNVAICKIVETFVGGVDPVIFTDGSTHNVHAVRKIVISAGTSGSGDANFSAAIDVSTLGDSVWQSSSSTSGVSISGITATITNVIRDWIINGKVLTLNFSILLVVSVGSSSFDIVIPLPVSSPTLMGNACMMLKGGTDKEFAFASANGANLSIHSTVASGTSILNFQGQITYKIA